MSDQADEEFKADEYGENAEMTASTSTALERDANAEFLSWIACEDGDCTNKENPAENAWVKLMSAIPTTNQIEDPMICAGTGFPTPSPEEIRALIMKIRPDDPDKFALEGLKNEWDKFRVDFGVNENTGVAGNLRAGLTALSDGWKGDDFDAFAEQVEIVIKNCETITEDIGEGNSGAVGILSQKSGEILALQGTSSGNVPYPAPLYWIKDKGGLFSNPCIHVRVPFAPDGCEVAEGCMFGDGAENGALELGGFDSSVVNEAKQYVEAQTQYYLAEGANQEPPVTEEQARRWAVADADRELGDVADVNEDNFEERASITNDDVVNRWENAEGAAGEFSPTATTSEPSTFEDSAGDLGDSGYSPPGGGGGGLSPGDMPTGSGPSGLDPVETPVPSTPDFDPGDPGGPGGPDFDPDGPGTGDPGDLDPWDPSDSGGDDDISGGLAGGGGGGLGGGLGGPGGGLGGGLGGPGGGLGGGAGGGGIGGGMMGAGGMGRGGGAGAGAGGRGGMRGAGAGAGGRGAGSGRMMGGMMGGGGARGMGGNDDQDGKETWLVEDDDVWGIGNEEEDPYA